MKSNESKKPSLTKRLLKQIRDQHRLNSKDVKLNPTIESNTPKPAELDQDAGGAYNPDHTYPQR